MFKRFDEPCQALILEAHEEARRRGSRMVEVEHLLLAFAQHGTVGLDPAALIEGLDDDAADEHKPRAVLRAPVPTRKPKLGPTAKTAHADTLQLALARGDDSLSPAHLLVVVVSSDSDTIARLLDRAAVHRAQLREAATRGLP